MKVDFKVMSIAELKAYVLANRQDDTAFHCLVDRLETDGVIVRFIRHRLRRRMWRLWKQRCENVWWDKLKFLNSTFSILNFVPFLQLCHR
jgi:hypothetical protein